ncbi:MAG: HAD-IIIA family hydrolase [Veillonella sp.]|uniref:KdsC family phosphatase n=1 Tax=Veillonella sp. TaxID=1926307 RepID=UPI0025CFE2BD|nr:HAD-IIIA family hydrolase [Veillonella sp.]MBS4913595.1 HAD-IIIA family hydrolase [Veillonella sp.]
MAIKCLVLDVDGVMTEGAIIYTSSGEEIKEFYAQDGLGLTMARKAGIKLAVITGRISDMVARRTSELKFDFVRMGSHNKTQDLKDLMKEFDLKPEELAYIGDDLNDLGAFHLVGYPISPANGVAEIKAEAAYVTKATGGRGAIREAVEKILKDQHQWDALVESYKNELYEQGQ